MEPFHRNVPDSDLIESVRTVAGIIGKNTVTIDEYNEHGQFHATTLTRRFKSWFNVLEKAGLEKSRSKIGISNHELFEEMQRCWVALGRQPKYSEMDEVSKYSVGTYEKRFGGWRKALKAFVEYINEGLEPEVDVPSKTKKRHSTKRYVNWRLRFLVMRRDNFTCKHCGASPAKNPNIELQVDHVVPWSRGGETVEGNLQTLCVKCNIGKSNL